MIALLHHTAVYIIDILVPIIKWPISESSLLFSSQYDTQAYNNYHKLYT